MELINENVANEVKSQLLSSRIINIRIPENESYAGMLILDKYNVFSYDKENKEFKSNSNHNLLLRIFDWFFSLVLFAIDCIFFSGFSLGSIYSIIRQIPIKNSNIIKGNLDCDDDFFKTLPKYKFRVRKKQKKTNGKLKNIIYIYFDEEPLKKTYNSILFLCEQIKCKRLTNTAIVIVSKAILNNPIQITLKIEEDKIDNEFIYNFSSELLDCIRNENYENAAVIINNILEAKNIDNPEQLEFVLQCLAFCYKKLNTADFINQFPGLNIDSQIDIAKKNYFIATCKPDDAFLTFCYKYLLKYYWNRSPVILDSLFKNQKKVVQNIKNALNSKDEYFSAAKLFAKFASTDDAADNYIIAFMHNEFVKNTVNDTCYNSIENYRTSAKSAQLFLDLYEISKQSNPNVNKVNNIIESIKNTKSNPLLRLCFYYYAVNPIYKNNCCTKDFLDEYIASYEELNDEEPLKCIFGAQFLLLFTTIEDSNLRYRIERSTSMILNYVIRKSESLTDKKTYIKICRSLNGLNIDCFNNNLRKMESLKDIINDFASERVYYYLNLGVTYAFRSNDEQNDYKEAIKAYKKIKSDIKNYPICIQDTYFSNLIVFEYLVSPSQNMATNCFEKLKKYAERNLNCEIISEEHRHIAINLFIFATLCGKPEKEINDILKYANKIIEEDKYFKFYLEQAKLLYSTLTGRILKKENNVDSVFFTNKKSLFSQKKKIMENVSKKSLSIKELNRILYSELSNFDEDCNYFKRADLFSLIERWYE